MAEEQKKQKQKNGGTRSLWRLLFWEGSALVGFYGMTRLSLPPGWKGVPFRENAAFFIAAYPLLFVCRWIGAEGFLGVLLNPVALVLGWILGASTYLWIEYGLWAAGSPAAGLLRSHWVPMGLLFIPVYGLFLINLMGISRIYYTMEECLALLLWAAMGGGGGFLLGKLLDEHLERTPFLENHRFMIWLSWVGVGVVLALLIARKKK